MADLPASGGTDTDPPVAFAFSVIQPRKQRPLNHWLPAISKKQADPGAMFERESLEKAELFQRIVLH